MNVKSPDTSPSWVAPDDTRELTDEFFDNAVFRVGEREVAADKGRAGRAAMAKARGVVARTAKRPSSCSPSGMTRM
jgi:hypothetical protein